MPTIRLLDQATVNKIAAGEVVERPASVVKEMVENSIDAGASKVTVEIEGGGIRLIRISDNGCGIDKEQVRTAFLRHSTSKIRKVEDLEEKATLGFRGEALASIAAVARVEMVTRTESELTGIRFIRLSGGYHGQGGKSVLQHPAPLQVFKETGSGSRLYHRPYAEDGTGTSGDLFPLYER